MGGGKKRRTIKQMDKTQKKKERKERGSSGAVTEKKGLGIVSPNLKNEEVVGQLRRMKVLTPYTVATRFDLRLSVAKYFLKELEKEGIVEFVSGSKNLKIYKPSVRAQTS